MKTRAELIDAVKVKLEEISPFDEPDSFIAADGDAAYADSVKPIKSYIESTIDEAVHNCLRALPLTLLHADIERKTDGLSVDTNGVGIITGINSAYRYIRFRHEALQRDITAFISSEDPLYLLDQNKHVRGGIAKPVAVVASFHDGSNAGQMEIYSFKPKMAENFDASSVSSDFALLYINTEKTAGSDSAKQFKSPIEELVVLECAAMVAEILGDVETAKICRQEQSSKIQATLQ